MLITFSQFATPFGALRLYATATGLCLVSFPCEEESLDAAWLSRTFGAWRLRPAGRGHEAAHEWLRCFFSGKPAKHGVPLDLRGTPFQLAVWRELAVIPWGETRTYAQVARRLGRPGAARAVGRACGANPAPLFVPCHRVTAVAGRGGYTPAPAIKDYLLSLEAAHGS